MLIEAFSAGKHPTKPELNEDAFVVVPGRAYAVIDGATDRSGRQYESGRSPGRMAAAAVAAALTVRFGASQPTPFEAEAVVEAATAAIGDEYRRLGITASARSDRNTRFNATLALAAADGPYLHLLLVGDSGIRVNGATVYQECKLLDDVTASLRVAAYRHLAARGVEPAAHDALARLVTFRGTRNCAAEVASALPAFELAAIEEEVLSHYRVAHPEVPDGDFRALVQGGIMFGQSLFQNERSSPLGYSCLDGFEVPMTLTRHVVLQSVEVTTIELFTDGYFAPGDSVGLRSWEQMANQVEREDPAKLGRYRSVKGSVAGGSRADDRTYLCVHP